MAMDVDGCRLEAEKRWSEVKMQLQHLEDEQKVLVARLNKQSSLLNDIQQLSTSVSLLANNMQSMLEEIKNQGRRIASLEQKPAKRWESVVEKVILAVVGAVVGAILVKIGLQG